MKQRYFSVFILVFSIFIALSSQFVHPSQFDKPVPIADKTLRQLEDLPKGELMQEWNNHLKNFSKADVFTIQISPRQIEPLGDIVMKKGDRVQGTYFVSKSMDTIDVKLFAPSAEILYNRRDEHAGIFYFYANETGVYELHFHNRKWVGEIFVTIAFSIGRAEGDGVVSKGEIDPFEEKMRARLAELEEVESETKFAHQRLDNYFKYVSGTHNKVFIVAIFETLCILGATLWQVYYIKKILENRRIL